MTSRTVKRAPAHSLQRRFAVIFVAAVILFLYLIKSTPSPDYQTHDEAVQAPLHAPLPAVRVLARETHTASIIWLHGLGESGHSWTFLSNRTDLPNVEWIFPHAPSIPITRNGGMMQPAWFDIWSFQEFMTRDDEEGMLQSVHVVDKLIAEEVDSGISSNRIFVGGFSQGCVIAILAGYLCERKLAGIIGVSGWLPLSHKFPAVGIRLAIADFKMRSDANLETPMLQLNGADDSVVIFKFAELSYLALREIGVNVEFHKIENMNHNPVQPEALDIMGDWLRRRVIT